MASYKGHLTFSTILGAAYGGYALLGLHYDWGTAGLACGLTAAGGLLPDLDSDSGVPVREMFSLAAAVIPFFLYKRLLFDTNLSHEQVICLLVILYLVIRYGLSRLFKRYTVHRGMYHSVPAMLIAGLIVYLLYKNPLMQLRIMLAGGAMLGFFSHLLLDEMYSVDFMGIGIHLNKYAGSALKFFSPSWLATSLTYLTLAFLSYLAYLDWLRL